MASAHRSTFEHQPLTLPKSIRVVVLEPAASLEAPVKCTLDEVDLDNIIPSSSYEALSYVWGERFGTIPISCHGRQLLVTPNCYDALLHLRVPSKRRRLFVDAVCIDQRQDLQQSIMERDHQIAIMGEVYKRARRVIVWLGQPHPSTPKLFRLMRFAHVIAPVENLARKIADSVGIKLEINSAAAYVKFIKLLEKDNSAGLQEAVNQLINNPWFTRIWTLQEEVFATRANLVVVYGCLQINYHDMLETACNYGVWRSFGRLSIKFLDSFITINDRYTFGHLATMAVEPAINERPPKWLNTEHFRILLDPHDFLGAVTSFNSTNPQDKIFGIYSIFTYLGLNLPPPNSSKSVAEIFETASREIIRSTASLGTLMLCCREASIVDGLPSWVPDWSVKRPRVDIPTTSANIFISRGRYKTTKNTGLKTSEITDFGKLTVRGTVFAKVQFYTVSSTTGTWDNHTDGGPSKHFHGFIQACRRWVRYIAISSTCPGGFPNINAIRRTLLLPFGLDPILSEERHEIESFTQCLDILLYPECQIHEPAVIKTEFIDPILEKGPRDPFLSTRSDTERVSSVVLLLYTSHLQRPPRWAHEFESIWRQIMIWANYALMILDTGHFARGFHFCKEGDIVALLEGCEFPVAIRPDGNGNYRFVAPLYVDGIMQGEAWPEDESKLEEITLV